MKPSEYAKALVGAALAGLTALGTALADGEGVTGLEGVGIVVAIVATFGTVFGVPNTPSLKHARRRSEAGAAPLETILYLLAALFFACMVVWFFGAIFGKL